MTEEFTVGKWIESFNIAYDFVSNYLCDWDEEFHYDETINELLSAFCKFANDERKQDRMIDLDSTKKAFEDIKTLVYVGYDTCCFYEVEGDGETYYAQFEHEGRKLNYSKWIMEFADGKTLSWDDDDSAWKELSEEQQHFAMMNGVFANRMTYTEVLQELLSIYTLACTLWGCEEDE